MNGILQGTTPKLVITIPVEHMLTAVTEIELTIQHKGTKLLLHLADVTVDTDANTITYAFTEAQTLALDPKEPLLWQLRLKTSNGIVGTLPSEVKVYDLLSEVIMP